MVSSSGSSALSGDRSERPPRADPSTRSPSNALHCETTCFLPFTELKALACASHTVFLPLFRARVARQQPFVLQRLAQLGVVLHECSGNPETYGSGLAGHASTRHRSQDIELVAGLGQHERLPDLHAKRFSREEPLEGAVIHADGPGSGPKKNPRRRSLPTTC